MPYSGFNAGFVLQTDVLLSLRNACTRYSQSGTTRGVYHEGGAPLSDADLQEGALEMLTHLLENLTREQTARRSRGLVKMPK